MAWWEIGLRLLLAVAAGCVIGIEREHKNRPAGMRTHVLVCVGAALIAICMFLSSLTESQLIAAVSGFCVSLMVILTDALAPLVDSPAVQTVLGWINFSTRYTPFTYGVFALENAVFFLSIAALFVYLTVARLERRRWS